MQSGANTIHLFFYKEMNCICTDSVYSCTIRKIQGLITTPKYKTRSPNMFDTTKEDLPKLLEKIDSGAIQLPDFQRDYVWAEEDVRSLIASVAKGFPVGALLTLEAGGAVRFKTRLLEGVPPRGRAPEELLLDGQQRMTSLYQATFSALPIKTLTPKNTKIERYYYFDIKKAVEIVADFTDAIIGVPADRILRKNFGRDVQLDLSTQEKEFALGCFPLNIVFDSRDWFYGWRDHCKAQGKDFADLEKTFVKGVVEAFERYKLPIIRLDKENSREAICLVFEKVNVGGKKLDAFELVTAIYAADGFDLREDWSGALGSAGPGRRGKIIGDGGKRSVLAEIKSTDFLQSSALLHSRKHRLEREAAGATGKDLPQVSCNRDALLALPLAAYREFSDRLQKGFADAGVFMNELRIFGHDDIPYPPLVIAIASVFGILERNEVTATVKEKLARWFWSATLGELYGSSTESRLAKDVPELVDWLRGSLSLPRSMDEAVFQTHRLLTLRSRLSAAYKGIHVLLMGSGCKDFISGRPAEIMTFHSDKIDIHHIFPRDWCKKQGINPNVFNSIINKTPLSKATNIAIGGDGPSSYLKTIERKHGISPETLDSILRGHLIEPAFLRNDDFKGFFEARREALSGLVSRAMGKLVVTSESGNETEEEADEIDEDELEDAV